MTRLLFAQGGQCFFCNGPLPPAEASVEHLVAKANGGKNGDGNCVACCISLNRMLGSMSLKEKIKVCLIQKGQFECPNGTQKKVKKAGPPPAPAKAKEVAAEDYEKVVANLKSHGSKKPATVKRLKNMIASLFHKKLSEGDVVALVQQLERRRVISVAGSKVTYA